MFLILLSIACKPSGGCSPADDPAVTIGTGENQYTEHQTGDTAELIYGPQGGVHITLALEATGFDADEDLVASFEGTIDGRRVGSSTPFVFLRCNQQTDTQQAWDLRLIYDDDPENLDDRTTEVTVVLQDGTGRSAAAQTTFVIDDPSL